MDSAKLNLLQNERLESFWDGLWLGIRTFLCFMVESSCVSLMESAKLNPLPNERLESFWDALWLGIRTFLCFKMSNWSQVGVSILKPVSAHPKPVLSGMSNRFQFIQNRFQNRFQTGFNENRFHRNRFHCKPFGGRFHRKPVSVTGFRFGLRSSLFF